MRLVKVLCAGLLLLVVAACSNSEWRPVGATVTEVRIADAGSVCRLYTKLDDGAVMVFTVSTPYDRDHLSKCLLSRKDDRIGLKARFDSKTNQVAAYYWEGMGGEYIPERELK